MSADYLPSGLTTVCRDLLARAKTRVRLCRDSRDALAQELARFQADAQFAAAYRAAGVDEDAMRRFVANADYALMEARRELTQLRHDVVFRVAFAGESRLPVGPTTPADLRALERSMRRARRRDRWTRSRFWSRLRRIALGVTKSVNVWRARLRYKNVCSWLGNRATR